MGEGNGDGEVPLIWTPTTAMNNWEVFQNDYEDLEELVGGIDMDQFLMEDDDRSWEDSDFELVNIGETRRTTLDEIHTVYENEIISDEGELNTSLDVPTSYSWPSENTTPYTHYREELNTFLDVPTSYSWLPENTTPYTHYREDEDYEGDDDEDYSSEERCLTEDEDHDFFDNEEVSTHSEDWEHTGTEIRIVEDDDSIYSEGNNSLYGYPHSEFGSLTPYTDEEDNPRDRCALLEKQIMFHDFKKLTIQDSEEEEAVNPHPEEGADYMDISSEYSRDDLMEIDEIYMLRSGEAYKEVPAITNIISELKNWTWEGSCPVEDHQKETKFFESTKISSGYGAAPHTIAEFTLGQFENLDFYDISLVYGFNVPMVFNPTSLKCTGIDCTGDLNGNCPTELKAPCGCNKPCTVFKTKEYCNAGSADCKATNYSMFLKGGCPGAYSFPLDDKLSTYTCPSGNNYNVVFCPLGSL
nr:thaumatin-like protein [Quercus suber]